MGAIKQTVMEMVDDITILVIKDKYGDDVYKDDGFRLKDNILDEFQELFDQIETYEKTFKSESHYLNWCKFMMSNYGGKVLEIKHHLELNKK